MTADQLMEAAWVQKREAQRRMRVTFVRSWNRWPYKCQKCGDRYLLPPDACPTLGCTGEYVRSVYTDTTRAQD